MLANRKKYMLPLPLAIVFGIVAVIVTSAVNAHFTEIQLQTQQRTLRTEGMNWTSLMSRTCGESWAKDDAGAFTVVVVANPNYVDDQPFWDESWHQLGLGATDPTSDDRYSFWLQPGEYLVGFKLGEKLVVSHPEGQFTSEDEFPPAGCLMRWKRYVVTTPTNIILGLHEFKLSQ